MILRRSLRVGNLVSIIYRIILFVIQYRGKYILLIKIFTANCKQVCIVCVCLDCCFKKEKEDIYHMITADRQYNI